MNLEGLALNASYLLMLVALTLRDILWLRVTLTGAQALFLLFGILTSTTPIIAWNVLFLVINLGQIRMITMERRPLALPPALDQIHRTTFPHLSSRGFQKLWNMGHTIQIRDSIVFSPGQSPISLLYILEGDVEIIDGPRTIAVLNTGQFVGEMEFVNNEPVTVMARARGIVRFRRWTRHDMIELERLDPHLCVRIQGVLGRNVMIKLQRTNPVRNLATSVHSAEGKRLQGSTQDSDRSLAAPGRPV